MPSTKTGSLSAANGKPRINPEYACFAMKLARSKIHRWGVYAGEFIPGNRKVIEYRGEKINRKETKRRSLEREFTYLFTLDAYWTIDGAAGGSGAEYINHSCDPNLTSRIMRGHIIYMSLRDINFGEELTVDYRFDKKVDKVACRCGSANCRGTINLVD